jgi:hypothetical protein
LGFLLTMVTIQAVPLVVARIEWAGAFSLLALGPVAGITSIHRLVRLRHPGARAIDHPRKEHRS